VSRATTKALQTRLRPGNDRDGTTLGRVNLGVALWGAALARYLAFPRMNPSRTARGSNSFLRTAKIWLTDQSELSYRALCNSSLTEEKAQTVLMSELSRLTQHFQILSASELSSMADRKPDLTLYTAQTPNGIKISIALEELGLVSKRNTFPTGSPLTCNQAV
jgi:hypothetical protein